MTLNIAQTANAIGFKNLADNITRLSYGKPIGRVSKTGIRGYSFVTPDGEKFITTVDKNFNVIAQTVKSKAGNHFKKEVFDKAGQLALTMECSKNADTIMHTVTAPYSKGSYEGLWAYELKNGKKVIFKNEVNILDKFV